MTGRDERAEKRRNLLWSLGALIPLALAGPAIAFAVETAPAETAPAYLADRGRGLPTSLFGTYIQKGEWLVYPFFEYTRTPHFEYHPSELGFTGETDFQSKLTEYEYQVFVSYGLTDRVAFELEGALHASASLEKAPEDTSAMPDPLQESGLGDTQAEVRWRWSEETETRPEMFSWLEVDFPFQRDKVILGTQNWETSLGFGVIKGFGWGTLTGRVTYAYDGEDNQVGFGEWGVEYLKRISQTWRFVGAIEGGSDEISAIVEGQARLGEHTALKLNSGFGLTRQAADFAPEVGVLFSF